jgi:FkbM family methyltransferase
LFQIDKKKISRLNIKKGKSHLFKTWLQLRFPRILPFTKSPNDARIFGYSVKNKYPLEVASLFNEIFIKQVYFFDTSTDKPFIIDCGSHIGMSILYFKLLYPNAEVLGFEPDPASFRFLKKNIENNNLKDVKLIKKALSNKNDKILFYGGRSATSSAFKNRGGNKVIEIEAVKLSNYIERNVDFLKIDVEGAEFGILQDLISKNKLKMINKIVVEYHHHMKKNDDRFSKFLGMFEDNNFGYQIGGLSKFPYEKNKFQDVMIFAYKK